MSSEAETVQAAGPMVFQTKLDEVIPRTYNVKSFRFNKPRGFKHMAGQWAYFSIKIGGKQMLHHFTLSSSPTEDFLEFTKKITDHPYAQALNTYKGGEWFMINGPYGEFTYSGGNIKIGALTGGIGITPIRSICKYCTDMKLPTSISLLYSNHTQKDIVFRDQFEEMERENPHLVIKNVLTGEPDWPGLKGHINAEMIKENIPDYRERVFYVSGPPSLNAAMMRELRKLGLPGRQILIDEFTGYT